MSACLCSFRALSRSRTPASKTLAPFLYQTATIQQWKPTTYRDASSRSKSEPDVPFEDEVLPPPVDEPQASRPTTITYQERVAFEKLYKKFNSPSNPPKGVSEHELDQVADEYYEDDEDNDPSATSLEALFDAALSGKRAANPRKPRPKKKKVDLVSLAEDILRPELEMAKELARDRAAAQQARIEKMRKGERQRVRALLEDATTDKELWDILEKEVFGVIRNMELDKESDVERFSYFFKPESKRKSKAKSQETRHLPHDPRPTDSTIIFHNYPLHLVDAAKILRNNFSVSPLPFNILPTLKSLGRSSYALGATTSLYAVLIHAAWIQNHSYMQICSLLQDMDNGGIEYDNGIATLLDAIINEHVLARHGRFGRGMRAVLGMELFGEGFQQIKAWRSAIKKRLGFHDETRVGQGKPIRRVQSGPPGRSSHRPDVASYDHHMPLVQDEPPEGLMTEVNDRLREKREGQLHRCQDEVEAQVV